MDSSTAHQPTCPAASYPPAIKSCSCSNSTPAHLYPACVMNAARIIWQCVHDQGQDALSHYDYAGIIAARVLGLDPAAYTERAKEYIAQARGES